MHAGSVLGYNAWGRGPIVFLLLGVSSEATALAMISPEATIFENIRRFRLAVAEDYIFGSHWPLQPLIAAHVR